MTKIYWPEARKTLLLYYDFVMGRRQEQRAARRAAAFTIAEHPVFDAPERAEDATDAYVEDALDHRADVCGERYATLGPQ